MVTGCDVLEAAHVHPHASEGTDDPSNGLLLRADIHTLFDCGLVAIHPDTLKVVVASGAHGADYDHLHGKPLRARTKKAVPLDVAALRARLHEFKRPKPYGRPRTMPATLPRTASHRVARPPFGGA